MWIKWKYIDHGHDDFKELEVPDDVVKAYGSIAEYIIQQGLVPTWSERFISGRIKTKVISGPSNETLEREIKKLRAGIKWRKNKLKQYLHILQNNNSYLGL